MLLKVYTGKCSEDGVNREGCKFQGLGAPFSRSMHTSWVRFKDVVGVMRNDFLKRLKGDQQGLPLVAVQCAFSRCAGCYWLKLPVNGVFLVQELCSSFIITRRLWTKRGSGTPNYIPPRCQGATRGRRYISIWWLGSQYSRPEKVSMYKADDRNINAYRVTLLFCDECFFNAHILFQLPVDQRTWFSGRWDATWMTVCALFKG